MRVVYCAGEQGRVVLDILRTSGDASDVRFADDDPTKHECRVDGIEVIGGIDAVGRRDDVSCLVAYGDSQGVRLDIAGRLEDVGVDFFDAIHPDSTISSGANRGVGVTVNAETYLGPGVELGNHVSIDSGVTVSHDGVLEDGTTIAPGVTMAGGVRVGTDAYVGPGATIVEDVTIGQGAIVGAGAVVTESIAANATVAGVPAEDI